MQTGNAYEPKEKLLQHIVALTFERPLHRLQRLPLTVDLMFEGEDPPKVKAIKAPLKHGLISSPELVRQVSLAVRGQHP